MEEPCFERKEREREGGRKERKRKKGKKKKERRKERKAKGCCLDRREMVPWETWISEDKTGRGHSQL
jgi:hypothetical protein